MQYARAAVSAMFGLMLVAGCERPKDAKPAISAADEISCTPRTTGAAGLPDDWQPFAATIDECAVRGPNGKTALSVVSVSASRQYAGKPDGTVTVPLPKPLIQSTSGSTIGRLPYSFPDDPPFATKLNFEQWKDGMPWEIRIAVRDPTVTGDHELIMTWDESTHEYIGGAEK